MEFATGAVHHWGSAGWWPVFPLLWIASWGAVIFALFRFRGVSRQRPGGEQVLAERYARGEISVEEYRERLQVLQEEGRLLSR